MNNPMNDIDAVIWAARHFARIDKANAAIHTAEVRYSPITFRLVEFIRQEVSGLVSSDAELADVAKANGTYAWDMGR